MELVVMRVAGDWSIMVDGRRRGRFDYEVDAVEAALRLARVQDPQPGGVQVMVQDMFGELRAVDDPQLAAVAPGRARRQAASPT